MKIIDVEQMSEEWFEARRGIPSASNFDKIITLIGKPSTQYKKYLYRLAGELVSKSSVETYQSASMKRGIELEPEARELYELINNVKVEKVGFCLEESTFKAGASPDGMVGEDGIIEIKCPDIHTHVEYLIKNELPSSYFQQTQGQLLITGRKWCDFVSYYPGLKPLIIRVFPATEFPIKLMVQLEIFCKELKEVINKIK